MTYDDETHYFSHRVEQQKNSMLMEKNEMMVAVEDLTVEKVSQSLITIFCTSFNLCRKVKSR